MLFVGLPCHIQAIKKLQFIQGKKSRESTSSFFSNVNWIQDINITIGLFCFENFRYSSFKEFIEGYTSLSDIDKIKINGGHGFLYSKKGATEIDLGKLRERVSDGCKICSDYSSKFADISIGSIGAPSGWSTLVVRTDKGRAFLTDAINNGFIEAKNSDASVVNAIKKIEEKKLKNASRNLKKYRNELPIFYEDLEKVGQKEILGMLSTQNFYSLDFNIVSKGLCVSCGACAISCPAGAIYMNNEFPNTTGECSEEPCGYCFISCPKTDILHGDVKKILGEVNKRDVFVVRAADSKIVENSQDGGATTSLVKFALEKGYVKEAVVTGTVMESPWKPESYIATSSNQLANSTKSKYSLSIPFAALIKRKERK